MNLFYQYKLFFVNIFLKIKIFNLFQYKILILNSNNCSCIIVKIICTLQDINFINYQTYISKDQNNPMLMTVFSKIILIKISFEPVASWLHRFLNHLWTQLDAFRHPNWKKWMVFICQTQNPLFSLADWIFKTSSLSKFIWIPPWFNSLLKWIMYFSKTIWLYLSFYSNLAF